LLPAALLLLLVCSAFAQGSPGPRVPPPDHWLTLDSLTPLVGLTVDQRAQVAESYGALNAVLREAAQRRAELRAQFQGQRPPPGEPPSSEQLARRDSLRAEFAAMQVEADEWHATIRNLLTAEQQVKFDALRPPRVMPQRRPGMSPPPPG
jgi:Spy/CpxP family protein refolding chaperone